MQILYKFLFVLSICMLKFDIKQCVFKFIIHEFRTTIFSMDIASHSVTILSIDSIATMNPLQNSNMQSIASSDEPCLHKIQWDKTVDICAHVIRKVESANWMPIPEHLRKTTLSRIPTELSLKSNPFPDMLLKLQPAIVIRLLPVATETFVLQLMKLQSVSNMLLLAVALIAQDAEFSTMHLSNVILDSDTHVKKFRYL